jgi:hypothetical protein
MVRRRRYTPTPSTGWPGTRRQPAYHDGREGVYGTFAIAYVRRLGSKALRVLAADSVVTALADHKCDADDEDDEDGDCVACHELTPEHIAAVAFLAAQTTDTTEETPE